MPQLCHQHFSSYLTTIFTTIVLLTATPPALAAHRQEGQKKITESESPLPVKEQSERSQKLITPARPVAIETLVAYARAAPAEFASDALIRIAESPKVVDPDWKRELLEEAFRRAPDAQYPVRRSYIGGMVDTRPGYLSYAFDLRLDALSLQCRAVKAMLSVDKKVARALFSEISPKLKLEPLGCEDALIYDVKEFYELLAEIVKTTFSPEGKRQNQHIEFLTSYIEGITSSAQVGPISKAILAVKHTPSQLSLLIYSFGNALKNLPADDRSFTHVVLRDSSGGGITELAEACKQMEVPREALLKGYRTYLVTHLSAGRCADNLPNGNRGYVPRMVEYLNKHLWPESPISEEVIKPSKISGRAQIYEYWSTPAAKRMLMGVKRLRFGTGAVRLTDAEKETLSWRIELAEYLNDLKGWDAQTEKIAADYFHQKSNMFAALSEIVPAGPARDEVMASFIGFLRENFIQRESRIEWLLHAKQLLDMAQSEERSNVLEMLGNSGDTNLRLYAGLAKLVPPSQQGTR